MKTLGWAVVVALGLSGTAFAGATDGPTLLTDGQLDLIVGGKKPRSTDGNGTDTNNDYDDNLVYEYVHAKSGEMVYQDYDAGQSTNKNLTLCTYGYYLDNNTYVKIDDC